MVNKIKIKVKQIILKPLMSDEKIASMEGTWIEMKHIKTLIKDDCDVWGLDANGKKKLLAKFRLLDHNMLTVDLLGGLLYKLPASVAGKASSASYDPSFGAIWSLPYTSDKLLKIQSTFETYSKDTQFVEQEYKDLKLGVSLEWRGFP